MRLARASRDAKRRGRVALAAAFLGALTTAPVLAQPVDHEARGFELATAGKPAEALEEFEAAYAATRAPQLLFVMGRMHAQLGDCPRAKDHFQRYLATNPGPKAAEAAQDGIDACKPAAPVQVEPAPPSPPIPTEPPPMEPVGSGHRPSLARAVVGDRLFQVGLGAGLVGAGLFVYSLQLSCWDGVCDGAYADYETKRDRAPVVAGAAIGFGAAAGALMVAAIVRQSGRGSDDALTVSAAPTAGGGMVGVVGAF